jgi:hypothetical protein
MVGPSLLYESDNEDSNNDCLFKEISRLVRPKESSKDTSNNKGFIKIVLRKNYIIINNNLNKEITSQNPSLKGSQGPSTPLTN